MQDFRKWVIMIWNFCTLDEDMLRQALFTLLDHDGDKALRMWRGLVCNYHHPHSYSHAHAHIWQPLMTFEQS